MSDSHSPGVTRREILQAAGGVAAASALAGVALPAVHAAEDNTIRVALVGCGGRGTGAAIQALSTKSAPTKLVAMADVFKDRLASSIDGIKKAVAAQGNKPAAEVDKIVDVPESRRFFGFDAYKNAMECLRKGDVVIFATPPAFRWVHFGQAVAKGLNVFMEKPVAVDGASARKMLKLGEESEKLGLKVGVGLMCRHCAARAELYDRIQKGAIGDLMLLQAYRQMGKEGNAEVEPRTPAELLYQVRNSVVGSLRDDGEIMRASEVLFQIKHFHGFLWASGGCFSDFYIHNIDECCWMKNAWPVQAEGSGGRHYRDNNIDQNFDNYSVEYTFKDGTKLQLEGRTMPGCRPRFASYAHGTTGSAIISTASHSPAKPRLYKGHVMTKEHEIWHFGKGDGKDEPNPYQLEWDHLIAAIRDNKPYNEVKRGTEASLVTAMGRMAAHTGQIITFDAMLNCDHEFAPAVDKLAIDPTAPLQAGPDGRYPVPEPGRKRREF
jgi:predicted dehydrogenase